MKLLIALGCSVFLHVVWLFFWPFIVPVNAKIEPVFSDKKPFELQLSHHHPTEIRALAVAENTVASNNITRLSNAHPPNLSHALNAPIQDFPTSQDVEIVYLSPKEVDIQALPINNIDASMLPAAMQNTQIKLRLLIDESGKIVRIAPIKTDLYQDETLIESLCAQLSQVRFTPAKRKGLEVKSYQDIAFGFQIHFNEELSQASNLD